MEWIKDYTDSDTHPQMVGAGFWGRTVFRALCRLSGRYGLDGRIPAGYLRPEFLAAYLGAADVYDTAIEAGLDPLACDVTGVTDASRGVTACVAVALIVREPDGSAQIPGWVNRQEKSFSAAERSRKYRESKKLAVTPASQPSRSGRDEDVTIVTLEREREREREREKKQKKPSSTCVDPPAPEAEVFDHWAKKLNHPRAVLDDKRRKLIREQLKLGTVEDLKQAIDGVLVDIQSWPKRQRFDGIEYVFENRASVEKFLDLALKGNPIVRSKDGYYRAEHSNKNRPPPGIVNL